MATTTLTLALDGEVPLDRFAKAVQHFCELVYALSAEMAPTARIAWTVEDAVAGGTQVTVCGTATDDEAVSAVATAYLNVGRALASGAPIPFADRIEDEAGALAELLDGTVRSLRFETAEDDALVTKTWDQWPWPPLKGAYGSVEGRVQSIKGCGTLRLTLLDHLFHRPVTCYLGEEQRALVRGAWGRRIVVEGWVHQDLRQERTVTVRRVTDVAFLPDVEPGSLITNARGILPWQPGDPRPEEIIRQMRDADG